MNVEEFFEFCRTHPEERYEYIHGYAYRLMAGGDSNHSLIKMNVYREFGNALRGGPCRAYDSDMHVRITDDQFVLPDASFSCDERDRGIVKVLTYPCLVVEVLSPSTKSVMSWRQRETWKWAISIGRYDQAQKLAYYSSVLTIQEYVLISTNEQLVVVHRRQQNQSWVTHLYRAGDQIAFTSLGLNLSIEVLYENVTFPANTPNGPSAERF